MSHTWSLRNIQQFHWWHDLFLPCSCSQDLFMCLLYKDREKIYALLFGRVFGYQCLPFGCGLTTQISPNASKLCRRGPRVLAISKSIIWDKTSLVSYMTILGFIVNWEKSSPWPAQPFVYLGIHHSDNESQIGVYWVLFASLSSEEAKLPTGSRDRESKLPSYCPQGL